MADFTDDIAVTATVESASFTDPGSVSLDIAASAGDQAAPLVAFALLSGTQIEKETGIVVEVTEDTALEALVILAYFAASGAYEVVYDGSDLASGYSTSTITPITDGNRFTIFRNNGWFVTPTIRVIAVDSSGNGGIPA